MRFKDFFTEKFIGNQHGLVYIDPSREELYKHVIPNITDKGTKLGDPIGVIFTTNHVWYFDRTEMEHSDCFTKFIQSKTSDSDDDVLPATVSKKGFRYVIHPAYYTMKNRNFLGYNDEVSDKEKSKNHLQAFLRSFGKLKIQNIVDNHPHIKNLKEPTPIGYTIEIDFTEGLR
jgi:hypothetical protein